MEASTRALLAYLDKVEPVLGKLTYFELLDVPSDAGHDQIQRAYHAVAARMHPDRHRSRITPQQHERLNIVYGRITEAYRVLRDDRERARYTAELARAGATATAAPRDDDQAVKLLPPKAQQLYRRAMAALRTGDTTSAMLNLKMALRGDPDSALLKAALRKVARQLKK